METGSRLGGVQFALQCLRGQNGSGDTFQRQALDYDGKHDNPISDCQDGRFPLTFGQ